MGVKLRAHDAELALQVIVIGVRQVVDRKDAQPIESQLGTFADAPKIGHIRDFPNGFGDIRITPFRNHIRLMLGERREVSPDAAVLGARRRVLGARRGVLGEKRVLGARTEDTSNAAGAVGVMLGSVALSGVWMTLRRKKKIQ